MRSMRVRKPSILLPVVTALIIGIAAFSVSSRVVIAQTAAPTWSNTGSMSTPRLWHQATRLRDGRVLITGGYALDRGAAPLATAEIYDPSTGTFTATRGNMSVARLSSATLLRDGRVLIAGGNVCDNVSCTALHSAEVYDPTTDSFTATGSMVTRADYAILLPDGKVLFLSGRGAAGSATAEIFDPASGTFAAAGTGENLNPEGAVLLPNGTVVLAESFNSSGNPPELRRFELYDPATGAYTITDAPLFPFVDDGTTMTLLKNGKVLVAGGENDFGNKFTAGIYDPSTRTIAATGDMTVAHGNIFTATRLQDGKVLFAGGQPGCNSVGSAEVYDPAAGAFSGTASMAVPRFGHTATLLLNGKVLVAGGLIEISDARGFCANNNTVTAAAELYDPGTSQTANPLDDPQFFVRQQYLDFLGREPDQSGADFWMNQITSCGADQQCIDTKRINVSAAYFLSIEFQQTGYLVYRMYHAAFGNLPNAPVPIRFNEFLPDTEEIGSGVVVGQTGWESTLENNKQAFATEFVQRPRFTSAYPQSLSPAEFVSRLNSN